MTSQVWWSASIRLVVFVGADPVEHAASVVLFHAPEGDWDAAFQHALQAGYALEQSYVNGDGQQVTWRLRDVQTLDTIGTDIQDGREVFFTTTPIGSEDVGVADLRPEETRPVQTGV